MQSLLNAKHLAGQHDQQHHAGDDTLPYLQTNAESIQQAARIAEFVKKNKSVLDFYVKDKNLEAAREQILRVVGMDETGEQVELLKTTKHKIQALQKLLSGDDQSIQINILSYDNIKDITCRFNDLLVLSVRPEGTELSAGFINIRDLTIPKKMQGKFSDDEDLRVFQHMTYLATALGDCTVSVRHIGNDGIPYAFSDGYSIKVPTDRLMASIAAFLYELASKASTAPERKTLQLAAVSYLGDQSKEVEAQLGELPLSEEDYYNRAIVDNNVIPGAKFPIGQILESYQEKAGYDFIRSTFYKYVSSAVTKHLPGRHNQQHHAGDGETEKNLRPLLGHMGLAESMFRAFSQADKYTDFAEHLTATMQVAAKLDSLVYPYTFRSLRLYASDDFKRITATAPGVQFTLTVPPGRVTAETLGEFDRWEGEPRLGDTQDGRLVSALASLQRVVENIGGGMIVLNGCSSVSAAVDANMSMRLNTSGVHTAIVSMYRSMIRHPKNRAEKRFLEDAVDKLTKEYLESCISLQGQVKGDDLIPVIDVVNTSVTDVVGTGSVLPLSTLVFDIMHNGTTSIPTYYKDVPEVVHAPAQHKHLAGRHNQQHHAGEEKGAHYYHWPNVIPYLDTSSHAISSALKMAEADPRDKKNMAKGVRNLIEVAEAFTGKELDFGSLVVTGDTNQHTGASTANSIKFCTRLTGNCELAVSYPVNASTGPFLSVTIKPRGKTNLPDLKKLEKLVSDRCAGVVLVITSDATEQVADMLDSGGYKLEMGFLRTMDIAGLYKNWLENPSTGISTRDLDKLMEISIVDLARDMTRQVADAYGKEEALPLEDAINFTVVDRYLVPGAEFSLLPLVLANSGNTKLMFSKALDSINLKHLPGRHEQQRHAGEHTSTDPEKLAYANSFLDKAYRVTVDNVQHAPYDNQLSVATAKVFVAHNPSFRDAFVKAARVAEDYSSKIYGSEGLIDEAFSVNITTSSPSKVTVTPNVGLIITQVECYADEEEPQITVTLDNADSYIFTRVEEFMRTHVGTVYLCNVRGIQPDLGNDGYQIRFHMSYVANGVFAYMNNVIPALDGVSTREKNILLQKFTEFETLHALRQSMSDQLAEQGAEDCEYMNVDDYVNLKIEDDIVTGATLEIASIVDDYGAAASPRHYNYRKVYPVAAKKLAGVRVFDKQQQELVDKLGDAVKNDLKTASDTRTADILQAVRDIRDVVSILDNKDVADGTLNLYGKTELRGAFTLNTGDVVSVYAYFDGRGVQIVATGQDKFCLPTDKLLDKLDLVLEKHNGVANIASTLKLTDVTSLVDRNYSLCVGEALNYIVNAYRAYLESVLPDLEGSLREKKEIGSRLDSMRHGNSFKDEIIADTKSEIIRRFGKATVSIEDYLSLSLVDNHVVPGVTVPMASIASEYGENQDWTVWLTKESDKSRITKHLPGRHNQQHHAGEDSSSLDALLRYCDTSPSLTSLYLKNHPDAQDAFVKAVRTLSQFSTDYLDRELGLRRLSVTATSEGEPLKLSLTNREEGLTTTAYVFTRTGSLGASLRIPNGAPGHTDEEIVELAEAAEASIAKLGGGSLGVVGSLGRVLVDFANAGYRFPNDSLDSAFGSSVSRSYAAWLLDITNKDERISAGEKSRLVRGLSANKRTEFQRNIAGQIKQLQADGVSLQDYVNLRVRDNHLVPGAEFSPYIILLNEEPSFTYEVEKEIPPLLQKHQPGRHNQQHHAGNEASEKPQTFTQTSLLNLIGQLYIDEGEHDRRIGKRSLLDSVPDELKAKVTSKLAAVTALSIQLTGHAPDPGSVNLNVTDGKITSLRVSFAVGEQRLELDASSDWTAVLVSGGNGDIRPRIADDDQSLTAIKDFIGDSGGGRITLARCIALDIDGLAKNEFSVLTPSIQVYNLASGYLTWVSNLAKEPAYRADIARLSTNLNDSDPVADMLSVQLHPKVSGDQQTSLPDFLSTELEDTVLIPGAKFTPAILLDSLQQYQAIFDAVLTVSSTRVDKHLPGAHNQKLHSGKHAGYSMVDVEKFWPLIDDGNNLAEGAKLSIRNSDLENKFVQAIVFQEQVKSALVQRQLHDTELCFDRDSGLTLSNQFFIKSDTSVSIKVTVENNLITGENSIVFTKSSDEQAVPAGIRVSAETLLAKYGGKLSIHNVQLADLGALTDAGGYEIGVSVSFTHRLCDEYCRRLNDKILDVGADPATLRKANDVWLRSSLRSSFREQLIPRGFNTLITDLATYVNFTVKDNVVVPGAEIPIVYLLDEPGEDLQLDLPTVSKSFKYPLVGVYKHMPGRHNQKHHAGDDGGSDVEQLKYVRQVLDAVHAVEISGYMEGTQHSKEMAWQLFQTNIGLQQAAVKVAEIAVRFSNMFGEGLENCELYVYVNGGSENVVLRGGLDKDITPIFYSKVPSSSFGDYTGATAHIYMTKEGTDKYLDTVDSFVKEVYGDVHAQSENISPYLLDKGYEVKIDETKTAIRLIAYLQSVLPNLSGSSTREKNKLLAVLNGQTVADDLRKSLDEQLDEQGVGVSRYVDIDKFVNLTFTDKVVTGATFELLGVVEHAGDNVYDFHKQYAPDGKKLAGTKMVSGRGTEVDVDTFEDLGEVGYTQVVGEVGTWDPGTRRDVALTAVEHMRRANGNGDNYIVRKDGEIVGVLRTYVRAFLDDSPSVVYVSGLATKRTGFALHLMKRVAETAVEHKMDVLLVPQDDVAKKFYEACGLEQAGDDDNPYMVWRLKDAKEFTKYRGA